MKNLMLEIYCLIRNFFVSVLVHRKMELPRGLVKMLVLRYRVNLQNKILMTDRSSDKSPELFVEICSPNRFLTYWSSFRNR